MTREFNSVVRESVRLAGRKKGGEEASHGLIMSAARARGGDISRSRMHARQSYQSRFANVPKKRNVIERGMCAIPKSQL